MPEKPKRKVGRPTIMTPELVEKLETCFAIGASDLEACSFADIPTSTLYNYQKAHPEFVERKERLKERPTLLARQTVVSGMKSDAHLALKYLERKRKDEFSLKQELEHSGNENKPVVIIDAGPNPYLDNGDVKPDAED